MATGTHLFLRVSITWPLGQAQPGRHTNAQMGDGLEQVALQGDAQVWKTWPATGQRDPEKRSILLQKLKLFLYNAY